MKKNASQEAADCKSHARSSKDPKVQDKYRKLRDSWIRTGNSAQFADDLIENAERPRTEAVAGTGDATGFRTLPRRR
jgi:hypothetical protein